MNPSLPMNPEIKTQWAAALRSGRYKQGVCWLRDKLDRFCCMGVLCDIIDPEGWRKEEDTNTWFYHEACACLPDWVAKKAGLPNDRSPRVTLPDGRVALLGELNDDGLTFEDLAKLIERSL